MRSREFIYELDTTLSSKIKQAIATQQQPQQAPGTTPQPNPNQAKTPTSTTGATGTANAQQATPGGTQTPQTPSTQQPTKPMGVGGAFLSGLTGGKASSLGSVAKMGATAVAKGAGLNSVAGAVDANRQGAEQDKLSAMGIQAPTPAPTAQELQTTLKQGSQIKIPGTDDFTIGKIDNTGIELTGKKLGKVKMDLKTLAGQQQK
jgi:hypothetical protein